MSIFEEGVVSILRMIGTECRAGPGRVLHLRDDAGRNPKNNAARTSGKRSRECFFCIGTMLWNGVVLIIFHDPNRFGNRLSL